MNASIGCLGSPQLEFRLFATDEDVVGQSYSAFDLISHLQNCLHFPDSQRDEALEALAHGKDVVFNAEKQTIYVLCGVVV